MLRTDGREERTVSKAGVCMCWPVMMRHSLCSRASVKRRDTMSSGLMRKRISSWTNPRPVTPPPTILLAKSTCGTRAQTQKHTFISGSKGRKRICNFTLEHGVKWRYGTEISDTRLTILTVWLVSQVVLVCHQRLQVLVKDMELKCTRVENRVMCSDVHRIKKKGNLKRSLICALFWSKTKSEKSVFFRVCTSVWLKSLDLY